MQHLFLDSASVLLRTLIIGLLAYVVLIFFLRVTGKRTLSKLNAFDFVVTVALGSTLASVLTSKDVALAQGALALGLLIGLQFVITWASVRFRWVRSLVTGEPTLLARKGALLHDALKRTRVTEDELNAALRGAGVASLAEIEAVVLETDGSISVVKPAGEPASTLKGVRTI